MKPKTNQNRKERSSEKDTVVAYHDFIQGQIQGELNGVTIGPGYLLSRIAIGSFVFGSLCLLVGILIIALRHRHVYLVSWDDAFLGPFFIIMFLLCSSFATMLLLIAKRRTNQYRNDLAFRPIGDYGVAVVHKSKLTYDEQKKMELKSGTTPHNVRHPGRQGVDDQRSYSRNRGYDNRGYKDDMGRKQGRDYSDGQYRDERSRNGHRPDGARRPRPPPEGERRRRPDGPRQAQNGVRRPLSPEEEKHRAEARRKYEEDKRRRLEDDNHRSELKKQAEAESNVQIIYTRPEERGVDVDNGTRQYKIQTSVNLSRQPQDMDESDL